MKEVVFAGDRRRRADFDGDLESLSADDFAQLRLDGLPASALDRSALPETLTQTLVEAGMAKSGKQVKDALGNSAVLVNGRALSRDDNADPAGCFAAERALHGRFYLVRLGKKKYHLFEAA